jgi:hypothetical protein
MRENSDVLWSQLGHAVAMTVKQDQISWTIFGIFWAANAVLLNALFTTGSIPSPIVGLIVSIFGMVLSWVWSQIQCRTIDYQNYYEKITLRLEGRLNIPPDISLSRGRNEETSNAILINSKSIRGLITKSTLISTVLWEIACIWFIMQSAVSC